MNRPVRTVRRAVPIRSLAAASLVATAGVLALAAVGATTASAANVGTITVGADGSYSPTTLTGAVGDTFTINATATTRFTGVVNGTGEVLDVAGIQPDCGVYAMPVAGTTTSGGTVKCVALAPLSTDFKIVKPGTIELWPFVYSGFPSFTETWGTPTTLTISAPAPPPAPAPAPAPAPPAPSVTPGGAPTVSAKAIRSSMTVNGAGTVTQRGTIVGTKVLACAGRATATAAGTVKVNCVLRPAARVARRIGAVRVRVVTTFTPTSGAAVTSTRTVRLPRTGRPVNPPVPVTG